MRYEIIEAPQEMVSDIRRKPIGVLVAFCFVRVFRSDSIHVLGYRLSDGVTYITSPLTAIDPVRHQVVARSGKVWALAREIPSPDDRLLDHLKLAMSMWKTSSVRSR
jgi:hypothetical protein